MTRRSLTRDEAADAARLKTLVERDPRSQLEIAFAAGWKTQGAVSQYTLGRIPLGLDAATRFARLLDCSLEEISPRLAAKVASINPGQSHSKDFRPPYFTVEPQPPSGLPDVTEPYRGHRDSTTVEIRQLTTQGSMGNGLPAQDHVEVVQMIRASVPELRRILPSFTAPKNLVIVTGLGDSMHGTFSDGDPIVVDTGVTEVRVDGCYVLERFGSELFIKRVQRQLDGSFLMISDNERYKPQVIQAEQMENFRVIGRALGVWNFQRL